VLIITMGHSHVFQIPVVRFNALANGLERYRYVTTFLVEGHDY